MTYKLVNKLLRRFVTIADRAGCPTFSGMLVHGVVFALLFRLMMDMGNLIEGNRGGRLADPRYNDKVEVEKLKNNKLTALMILLGHLFVIGLVFYGNSIS